MKKLLLITAMFMAMNTWSVEIKQLQYIEQETGGNFRIYCISLDDTDKGYMFINGPFSSTTPVQMFEIREIVLDGKTTPFSLPTECSTVKK